MFDRLLSLFYPPRCIFCGKTIGGTEPGACEQCLREVRECGRPYAAKKPYYEKAAAVFRYEGKIRSAVHRYKFRGETHIVHFFGRRLAELVEKEGIEADIITSPPSSSRRVFEKGYDHAFLLAKRTGRHLGIPAKKLLYKTRRTAPMFGLESSERRANIAGSVGVRKKNIKGKTVLLIDDVLTTGATASECARVLLTAGAKKVFVAAAAAKK